MIEVEYSIVVINKDGLEDGSGTDTINLLSLVKLSTAKNTVIWWVERRPDE